MSWTCQRQTDGVRCGQLNDNRKRKCGTCSKPRPLRRKPAHLAALEVGYEEYIERTGGEFCALCGALPHPGKRLQRDHDHRTGAPRKLLCFRCNRALPSWVTREWLLRAADYVS